ncbi:MAG: hypothetical protein ACOYNF_01405 [Rhodoferax sp.]
MATLTIPGTVFSSNPCGTTQGTTDEFVHFFSSAFNRLVQIGAKMLDGQRLMTLQASFHGALNAFCGVFLAGIFIAQVNFNAGDLAGKALQRGFHRAAGPLGHGIRTLDMIVSVNLDLHVAFLLKWLP